MSPSPDQMDTIRSYAQSLVLSRLPFCRDCKHDDKTTHRQSYDEIVSAMGYNWSPGATGTTCGYLCHWLLWKIGVTNSDVVNWTDTSRGTKFTYGSRNMSMIYCGGNLPFVTITPPNTNLLESSPLTTGPKPGDIILLQKYNEKGEYQSNTEHAFVFLSNNPHDDLFSDRKDLVASKIPAGASASPLIWVTGESGQGATGKATDGLLKSRKINLTGSPQSSTTLEDATMRTIKGWLSLDNLDFDAGVVDSIVNPGCEG